jgi:hypothetical protein
MKKQLTHRMAAVMSGILVLSGFAMSLKAQAAENTYSVVVTIHNYAGVAPETLALAEAQAAKIYREAGVMIQWRELTLPDEGSASSPVNQPAVRPIAYVKLISNSNIQAFHRSPGALGWALGRQVYVFVDRLQKAIAFAECPFHVALGHVIAHEMGHALLGPGNHALGSVMSPQMGEKQFRQMQMGGLLFCAKQVKQIQELLPTQEPVQMAASEVR